MLSALLLIFFGFVFDSGPLYWTGLIIFSTLLFYQHSLVKPDNLSRLNLAFFTLNGIASLIFALFTITDILT
jgi:4-hydroxybenzoate polyprenyltransferase